MVTRLSQPQLEELTPLLGPLARLIVRSVEPTQSQLEALLRSVDSDLDQIVVEELARWATLLKGLRDDPTEQMRLVTEEALKLRGVPEASAILASGLLAEHNTYADAPAPPTLSWTPQQLDFGVLPHGGSKELIIEVQGDAGKVSCESDQVVTDPEEFALGPTSIRVRVSHRGASTLWTQLHLETQSGSADVPLLATWEAKKTNVTASRRRARDTGNAARSAATNRSSSSGVTLDEPDFRVAYAMIAALVTAVAAVFIWVWFTGRDAPDDASAQQRAATVIAVAYLEAIAIADANNAALLAEQSTATAAALAYAEAVATADAARTSQSSPEPDPASGATHPDGSPADEGDAQPNPTIVQVAGGALFCSERYYEGTCWPVDSSIPDLTKTVRSFRLYDVSIALFSEDGYQGLCDSYSIDVVDYRGSPARLDLITNPGWVMLAKSVRVNEGPCPSMPVLCASANLSGTCLRLDGDMVDNVSGRRDGTPGLTALSAQVPPGIEVTVYSKTNWTGDCATLTADVPNLQESPLGAYAYSARLGRHC